MSSTVPVPGLRSEDIPQAAILVANMIEAYLDEPRTLEELRQAVSNPKQGYDIHHIVEKTSAEDDGFPKSMIHGPDNLVRVPRFKHWEITSWYMTKNDAYQKTATQGLPARQDLGRTKSGWP